jgi:hypothetical protein
VGQKLFANVMAITSPWSESCENVGMDINLEQWLGQSKKDAEKARARGKALRVALSRAWEGSDELMAYKACCDFGELFLPSSGWRAQEESDKVWRAVLSIGQAEGDWMSSLYDATPKKKMMIRACARGIKAKAYAGGSVDGEGWAMKFARERLLWRGEVDGDGLAALLCAQEMIHNDPGCAQAIAKAMGEALESGALDEPPRVAVMLRARALTLRAQSVPDALMGRDRSMDDAYYLGARDALMGRWDSGLDMVDWVRSRGKAWSSHADGSWLSSLIEWVGAQDLASRAKLNIALLNKLLAAMGRQECAKAASLWESVDGPKALCSEQAEVIARVQSEALRGAAGSGRLARAKSRSI